MLTSEDSIANGNAENPLTDDEIDAKFAAFMASAGLADKADDVSLAVKDLDQASGLADLIDLITAPVSPA